MKTILMELKVIVNPNPFTSELSVFIHGSFAVNIVIRLLNSRNTVIRIRACLLIKGDNKIMISNLQRYATGHYHVEIKLLNGDLLERINLIKT